jgi:hypothetical protein
MQIWNRLTNTWRGKAVGCLLMAILLFGASYIALPRTADGLIVTVTQSQNPEIPYGPEHVIFKRTYSGDTVASVRDELYRLARLSPFDANIGCPLERGEYHYTDNFLLIWHGMPVQNYFTQSGTGCGYWDIQTLGVPELTRGLTVKGTWVNLGRLTGMPLFDGYQCPDCHLGPS